MKNFTKKILFSAIILLMIAFVFYACTKKQDRAVPDYGYAYYPYGIGKYAIYAMDSIIYNGYNNTIDTNHYEVKDICVDTFSDNQGRTSYLIDRYFLDTASQTWQPVMDYYITPTSARIELVENNLRYVKMVFPIAENYSWNGNIYIDPSSDENLQYLDGWNYTYSNVNQPATILNNTFDSTLTINEINDSTAIQAYAYQLYSVEKYAKNVGLIYRHIIYWQQQCASYDQSGNCQALGPKDGWEVTMQIMDHN